MNLNRNYLLKTNVKNGEEQDDLDLEFPEFHGRRGREKTIKIEGRDIVYKRKLDDQYSVRFYTKRKKIMLFSIQKHVNKRNLYVFSKTQ